MKSTHHYHAGVDVSKDELVAFCPLWKSPRTFDNSASGIRALFKVLPDQAHLVCEASGGYEKRLAVACFEKSLPVSVINARQIHDFAKASGRLAKTDVIDATMITAFADCFEPDADTPPSPVQIALKEAVRHRERLMRERVRALSRLEKTSNAFVRGDLKRGLKSLDKRIERIGSHLAELAASEKAVHEKQQRLEQIKGIGPVSSITLLAEFPELGSISDKQAASLLGVAPFNKDSGRHRGTRHIQGGRGLIRRTLYMPTLCATRNNPHLKAFYGRLTAKGKPHHVAITATMRKLICLLNRMLADPDFRPA